MKMKALAAIMLALLIGVFTVGAVYAQTEGRGPDDVFQQKFGQQKAMAFEGTVLSHDVACHCIVLKTAKGNLTLQDDYAKFATDYNRAKGLAIGAKIGGSYKTVDYINYATEIHMVK